MTIFTTDIGDSSTTSLTGWYDHVIPHVPGITPGPAVLLAIREAVIEYYRMSRTYSVEHQAIDLVAETGLYNLSAGSGLSIIEPKEVRISGVEIANLSEEGVRQEFGLDWKTRFDTPTYYFCPSSDRIRLALAPASDAVGALTLDVYVTLSATANAVPSRLFDNQDSRLGIAKGAIANLALSPNKPYSNMEIGIAARHSFERAFGIADIIRAKGGGNAPLRSAVVHGIA